MTADTTASRPTEVADLSPLFRWSVLVVISLAMFGNYYVYDSISPLADVLKAQLGFSDANIGLLNAIYSFPNIIMVLIGGVIIDRIGARKATLLFGFLCFAGAAITVASGSLVVMATGRLVFGLGAESLIVAVTTAIAKWFRGKELSFAFGMNLTIARLGSFAALNAPSWASSAYESWRTPLLISVGMASFCITGAILYWILEARAESRYSLGQEGGTDKVVWKDLFNFGTSYWYVVALCITFYSAIFPFQTFAVKLFMEAHGTTREVGGALSSLLTLFAMICTPLFGLLVDKVGKRSLFMMFGSLLLTPVYLLMAYTRMPQLVLFSVPVPFSDMVFPVYLPMIMMGVAFSLIPAVMWPSVAYIVDQNKLGTAYGLMTMIQNIGLFGFNLLIGWSNDHWLASAANPTGYRAGLWIFSCLGLFGLLFAFLLRRAETGPHAHGLETIKAGGQST
ncbi:MAG: MFS transporter [Thermoanaerobaculaceae bacterium]|jgi:MFS family permease|nr:MFS transporter [Thermoanaerobaculaceae bacterium]